MGALCLLPSTPPSCSGRGPSHSSRPPGLAAAPLLPRSCCSSSPRLALAGERRRRLSGVARVKGGKNGGAEFFREDGVVDDMDGYLNYLSLEYDSVWDTKPAWCQPWTILLSGAIAVAFSWVLIHSAVITGGVSFVICAWWYIFLYSYPRTRTLPESTRKGSTSTSRSRNLRTLLSQISRSPTLKRSLATPTRTRIFISQLPVGVVKTD